MPIQHVTYPPSRGQGVVRLKTTKDDADSRKSPCVQASRMFPGVRSRNRSCSICSRVNVSVHSRIAYCWYVCHSGSNFSDMSVRTNRFLNGGSHLCVDYDRYTPTLSVGQRAPRPSRAAAAMLFRRNTATGGRHVAITSTALLVSDSIPVNISARICTRHIRGRAI